MAQETTDMMDANGKKPASYYLDLIETAQNSPEYKEWSDRCKKIRKKYRYESSATNKTRKYQILWSNMEVMKPSVLSKPPVPVVQRRYKDKDAVGREACDLLERACRFQVEANDYFSRLEKVRDDYLLYARGIARLYYEPVTVTVEDADDVDGLDEEAMRGPDAERAEETEDAGVANNPQEILDFENVKLRHVQREDFVHQAARSWDEVQWVAFRAYLTKEELVERFGEEVAGNIPLDASPEAPSEAMNTNPMPAQTSKATIWEFWDREAQKVVWIAKGYPQGVLEESDPYLKLDGFYPCPKPAFGTLTTDSLAPIPDYVYYQDQAEEIDTLTARIGSLQQSLKLVGFYPAGPQGEGAPEVERAMSPGFENKLIAVKSWAVFQNSSGKGQAPIVWLPIEEVAQLIKDCVELRKQLIEDVYQIAGISDIMRGDAQASETATAQQIKAQFGSVRLKERQQELARFSRDIIRMLAQIICDQFQPETLLKMTNMDLPTEQQVAAMMAQQQLMAQQAAMQQAQQPPQIAPPQAPQGMPNAAA
jgi:hypothetical protein